MVLSIILSCLCILITRVISILLRHKKITEKKVNEKEKLSVLIVLGSGGHTSEMLAILHKLPTLEPWKISFLIDEFDQHSRDRVNAVPYLRTNVTFLTFCSSYCIS
jgi:FlaA1/EpsC-like NDP-sugar epimerase